MLKNKLFVSLTIIIALLVIAMVTFDMKQSRDQLVHLHKEKQMELTGKELVKEAKIGGIGDILIHDRVYHDAKTKTGYDFHPMLLPVKELLQTPDFLIANQESIPGGPALGISSYPMFNSPYEIVDAIIDAGVDFVSTANNHSLDRREQGILNAIAYFEKKGLPYVGTFKNQHDQQQLRIETINGVKTAILAYTYGTNGIPIPEGKEYLVNIIDKDKILKEITRARKQADIVVVNLHWGIEYVRQPNEQQKELAKVLTDGGADIILGHHPHVLQPIERRQTSDGREAVIVYSLGNFLSGQYKEYKDIGGMVEITIEKKLTIDGQKLQLKEIAFYPTYLRKKGHTVFPLEEAYDKGMTNISPEDIITHMMDGGK